MPNGSNMTQHCWRPNEYNMLDPACWTQGSGTKIYLKSLENKISPCWRFQVPFKIINRLLTVTLYNSKRTAVPESGNYNSKCVVCRGLALCKCEEPCEDPGHHCVGSSVPGSWLAKDPADTLVPCPWELWTQEGLFVRREIAFSSFHRSGIQDLTRSPFWSLNWRGNAWNRCNE